MMLDLTRIYTIFLEELQHCIAGQNDGSLAGPW